MDSSSFQTKAGFTLIELLVTVAIIAILAVIALPVYQSYRVQAFDTVAKSDLKAAITALEAYAIGNGAYPASSADLLASGHSLSQGVSFTTYKVGNWNGGQTVHMHVKHASSPNKWHVNYPKEGGVIEIR